MTEDERRAILVDIAVEEAKRIIRAASRRHGETVFDSWQAFHDAMVVPAVAGVAEALRKSGGADMLPVAISMERDPRHPGQPCKVVLVFEGPLFP